MYVIISEYDQWVTIIASSACQGISSCDCLSSCFVHHQAFHNADLNHKGFLSREDIKVAMLELFGYKPSKVGCITVVIMYICTLIEDDIV